MKDWKKGIIPVVAVVAWMVVIFAFSAQPGEVSGDLSGSFSHRICKLINGLFHMGRSETELLTMAEWIDYPVRKCAHMTEYAILAALVFGTTQVHRRLELGLYARKRNGRWDYGVAMLVVVLYACTDEFHQLFVPERAGRLFDVGVDSTGAVLMLFLIWGIRNVYAGRTKHKKCP